MTPKEVLKTLMEGNQRFVRESSEHPNRCHETRILTSKRQTPMAVVLTCSDSRVSPEIIFDLGIGDLFTIRVAGNVVGPVELASIDFGVNTLGAQLILVLGHENCGAIQAVLGGKGAQIAAIAELLQIGDSKLEADAAKHNVQHVVQTLKSHFEKEVAGGYYHLETGLVELIK